LDFIKSAMPFEKVPKTYNEEKTASSTNVAGKTGYLLARNGN
jgi:hypothetical protein